MKRINGGAGIAFIECINPRYKKYKVRWDIQPHYDRDGDIHGVDYMEADFNHKPTIDEIKAVVLDGYNQQIDAAILSGFEWNGNPVWLSSENQHNYKAAYDLAVQTGGTNLPVVFKFGTTESPVYHEFQSVEELSDFYINAMNYISTQLKQGWEKKDAIDWTVYEI